MYPGILRERLFRVRNNQRRANFRLAAYAGRLNAEPASRKQGETRLSHSVRAYGVFTTSSLLFALASPLLARSRDTLRKRARVIVEVKIVRSEVITQLTGSDM